MLWVIPVQILCQSLLFGSPMVILDGLDYARTRSQIVLTMGNVDSVATSLTSGAAVHQDRLNETTKAFAEQRIGPNGIYQMCPAITSIRQLKRTRLKSGGLGSNVCEIEAVDDVSWSGAPSDMLYRLSSTGACMHATGRSPTFWRHPASAFHTYVTPRSHSPESCWIASSVFYL